MQSRLKRIVPGLRGRRAHARLMIEPPKPVGEGWLIRLRCQNPGVPGTFDAEVVSIEGTSAPRSELPWKLLWRGQPANEPVKLQTRGGELLRLAIFHPAEPSTFVLLAAPADGGGGEVRRPVGGSDGIVVTVRVRRGSHVDVEKRIKLSSRQSEGRPFVPIVTLDS
jgi:hypothetical protein